MEDYISLSAGATNRSDPVSHLYCSRQWFGYDARLELVAFSDAGMKSLRPGDSIVVPVDSQHKESLAQWRDYTDYIKVWCRLLHWLTSKFKSRPLGAIKMSDMQGWPQPDTVG